MTTEITEKVDMPAIIEYSGDTKYIQYTIRNVSADVDRVLRARAAKERLSLNDVILQALSHAAGNPDNHDLDFLFGAWFEDKTTNKALANQRKIDYELWR